MVQPIDAELANRNAAAYDKAHPSPQYEARHAVPYGLRDAEIMVGKVRVHIRAGAKWREGDKWVQLSIWNVNPDLVDYEAQAVVKRLEDLFWPLT